MMKKHVSSVVFHCQFTASVKLDKKMEKAIKSLKTIEI